MILKYVKSESANYPELIDKTSSKKYVYLRKNIVEVQKEEVIMYDYEEAKLTHKEYEQYLKELSIIDIQQQRADIDYIALMSDISLDYDSYPVMTLDEYSYYYNKIKTYYDSKLWDKVRVYNMTNKNIITQEEYEMITGESYQKD